MKIKVEKFNPVLKFLWYLLFGIGYLILYLDYFTPTEWGKKRNTAVTARRLGAKHFWGPINALFIWFLFIAFIFTS